MSGRKKSNRAMRFHVGRCSECGDPIPMTDLWCEEHRKSGPIPGSLTVKTYENAEKNHGDRIRDMINAGKI